MTEHSVNLSLIIACHDRVDLTKELLRSLVDTLPHGCAEVMIVDDGSTDGTADWLRENRQPRWKVITNEKSIGFAAANNDAAKQAVGGVLVFLNNDLVMRPGWLEPMIAALDAHPTAFAVGNVQHAVSNGSLDHAGMLFDLNGHPVHYRPSENMLTSTDVREFPAVTFACCAVRKDRFLELSGFDESYRNGYEDVDLCLRAREKGWKCFVANMSVVDHHVSASPGRKNHEEANMRLFFERWGSTARELGHEWRERLTAEESSLSPAPIVDENAGYVHAPGMIHFVDEPTSWDDPVPLHIVRGWCFNRDGIPVHSVRARTPDGIWEGVQGMERPDVATAHEHANGSLRSGFTVRFPRPKKIPSEVALEAVLEDGSLVLLRKVIIR